MPTALLCLTKQESSDHLYSNVEGPSLNTCKRVWSSLWRAAWAFTPPSAPTPERVPGPWAAEGGRRPSAGGRQSSPHGPFLAGVGDAFSFLASVINMRWALNQTEGCSTGRPVCAVHQGARGLHVAIQTHTG